MNTKTTLNRADMFELIVARMIEQGIEDSEQFMEFITETLPNMSNEAMSDQLAILEELAQ